MANPFVHVELNTTDLSKAKTFYGALFDWKLEDVPMGAMGMYTTIGVGGGVGGGMMTHPMPGQPSFWLSYVNVDDIKAATAKAKSLGANIIRDVTPVAEMGFLSILMDPTGAVLGLWQEKKKA
jgi:predicted enzyme related to lactoylglutathione lyase